jgi:hypothetical protein
MNVGELGAQLLSGEKVIDSYSCKFSFKSMAIRSKTGKLFLTNYRVCFATPSVRHRCSHFIKMLASPQFPARWKNVSSLTRCKSGLWNGNL